MLLPGRIPGFKNKDIQLLSSSDTKMNVWKSFKRACEESNKQAVYRLVETILSKCCRVETDDRLMLHLPTKHFQVTSSRQSSRRRKVRMRKVCEEAKCSFQAVEDQIDLDERHESCSLTTMHYSFDFAQQVHIPSNPMQPGPIYFKTPRKCSIFGVMCEAIPRQVNYLIDEASDVGKGANITISYVHHYFEHHGLGETSVHLNADNCSGQNKNNYFIWYLAWRTILQLHHSVRYSFLIARHTKFGPDRCFGIIKKSYKLLCCDTHPKP